MNKQYEKTIINMEIITAIIKKGERLLSALKRIGHKNIPSKIVLDKTLTGIGATYAELHSHRHSIIIEPNVPVILQKTDEHKNLQPLAVYAKCSEATIKKYLNSNVQYKKLLCTPESYKKIKKAAEQTGVNLYADFFCLMDECEKFIQDIDYRKRISQPINDFFQFNKKAMVSATPLKMRHPELERQNFKKIKITPDYDYKVNLNLIVTNNYDKIVREQFEQYQGSECVCIFLNSTNGINRIINTLGIENESKVFCSQQSVDKLQKCNFSNISENMAYPFAKYNFFTCRFYSAVDIVLPLKADILLLTNLKEAYYTMIDPFTEAIQIQGRFRNEFEEGYRFNSLTHITTIDKEIQAMDEDTTTQVLNQHEETYNSLRIKEEQTTNKFVKQSINKDKNAVKYAELLDEDGNINYFSIDNFYNEERVKGYYQSAELLKQAYEEAQYFNVNYAARIEAFRKDDLLLLKQPQSEIDKRRLIIRLLDNLNKEKQENPNFDCTPAMEMIKAQKDSELMIRAYHKLGKQRLDEIGYTKSKIESAIKHYDEQYRFSQPVVNDIRIEFDPILNIPTSKDEIRDKVQLIYNKFDIGTTVNLNTIEKYYHATSTNSTKPYKYTLKYFRLELVQNWMLPI